MLYDGIPLIIGMPLYKWLQVVDIQLHSVLIKSMWCLVDLFVYSNCSFSLKQGSYCYLSIHI